MKKFLFLVIWFLLSLIGFVVAYNSEQYFNYLDENTKKLAIKFEKSLENKIKQTNWIDKKIKIIENYLKTIEQIKNKIKVVVNNKKQNCIWVCLEKLLNQETNYNYLLEYLKQSTLEKKTDLIYLSTNKQQNSNSIVDKNDETDSSFEDSKYLNIEFINRQLQDWKKSFENDKNLEKVKIWMDILNKNTDNELFNILELQFLSWYLDFNRNDINFSLISNLKFPTTSWVVDLRTSLNDMKLNLDWINWEMSWNIKFNYSWLSNQTLNYDIDIDTIIFENEHFTKINKFNYTWKNLTISQVVLFNFFDVALKEKKYLTKSTKLFDVDDSILNFQNSLSWFKLTYDYLKNYNWFDKYNDLYKKEWNRYYLIKSKISCWKHSFYYSNCTNSQYYDYINDFIDWDSEFYFELWKNDDIFYYWNDKNWFLSKWKLDLKNKKLVYDIWSWYIDDNVYLESTFSWGSLIQKLEILFDEWKKLNLNFSWIKQWTQVLQWNVSIQYLSDSLVEPKYYFNLKFNWEKYSWSWFVSILWSKIFDLNILWTYNSFKDFDFSINWELNSYLLELLASSDLLEWFETNSQNIWNEKLNYNLTISNKNWTSNFKIWVRSNDLDSPIELNVDYKLSYTPDNWKKIVKPIDFFIVSIVSWKSMYPTLDDFDYVVLQKSNSYKRWDIIVFQNPVDPSINFIKRIIWVWWEKISIKNWKIEICDKIWCEFLNESYIEKTIKTLPFQWKTEFVIPQNSYFVLWDNRENSMDSRYCFSINWCSSNWLFYVDEQLILWKAIKIIPF